MGRDGGFDAGTYGERIAGVYDEWYKRADVAMIDRLAEMAGKGPALELGIGTGRIALPLAARGVAVHGIDASPAMVERLRAKPGGEGPKITFGSFADFDLDERAFTLVFVVFNTFFALTTQEEQLSCFRSVARHLASGGAFVLETFVPDMTRFTRGQNLSTVDVSADQVILEASVHDGSTQRVSGQHVLVSSGRTELYPVEIRYAWPAEMDLMAMLAGLRRRDRWSSWTRAPFTRSSTAQVVVYERAG
jgi:SAM-dependent methyltransferase